jgi:acetyl-CoA carboxylase biotin carboxyl carrier protein
VVNVNKLARLIELVESRDIDQLEVTGWGRTIRITKRLAGAAVAVNGRAVMEPAVIAPTPAPAAPPPADAPAPAPEPKVAEAAAAAPPESVAGDTGGAPITSPMVGTFYAAPAPDAAPFVKEGDMVEVGQVVCIVEAMKLMNEIQSDIRGRIKRVMVANAQPVEYGQTLFLVDPAG